MIHEVAGLMRQGLTYYEALKLVLKCVVAALKCERAEIYLVEESDQTWVARSPSAPRGVTRPGPASGCNWESTSKTPSPAWCTQGGLRGRRRARVPDPGWLDLQRQGADPGAGRALGVLSVDYLGAIRPRNRSEVLGLLTFATQVGFILENIRLHFEIIQLAFRTS
jgi:hypothetical protein